MARIAVKVSHPIAGGHLGSLVYRTMSVSYGAGLVVNGFKLIRVMMSERADLMPDGSGRVLHSTVKRHVRQFLKDTRYCFTNDPESGFQCEMRVL